MKKSIFGLSLIALSFMFSANVAANDLNLQNEIILQKNLKRIKIDRWIKDSSGTSWHITGWVDVSIGFGGVSISDYDVTMTGGGHSYHFEGKIARSENPDSTISHRIDGKLSEDGKVIPINTELKQLLIDCNEEVLKENN